MPYKNPEDRKKYRDTHKEEARAYSAWYRANHPEEMAKYKRDHTAKVGQENITIQRREYHQIRYRNNKSIYNAQQKEYRLSNPDKIYDKEIRRKFNITLSQKETMWIEQDKRCKICLRAIGLRPSHIDHFHGSDPIVIRGLLCGSCNRGIGLFHDSVLRLRRAANYLLSDLNSPSEA